MSTKTRVLARADALYSSIAMTVTILELALISTNPSLGKFALEFVLIIQLVLALIIEFIAGSCNFVIGLKNTVQLGFFAKLATAICFALAFILSFKNDFYLAWLFLVLSYVVDSIGTGCLKTAFKPAYNLFYKTNSDNDADFIDIFKYYLHLRIWLPFFVLALSCFLIKLFPMEISFTLIIVCMMILRLIQIFITKQDLSSVHKDVYKIEKANIFKIIPRAIRIVYKIPKNSMEFVLGNLFETIVLIYFTGLIYRYGKSFGKPLFFSWIGSSLIAFVIYILLSIASNKILIHLSGHEESKTIKFMLILSCLISPLLIILAPNTDHYMFFAISFSSVIGIITGMALMRLSINQSLKTLVTTEQPTFFIAVESLTTLLLIILSLLAYWIFGVQSILSVLCYGLLFFTLLTAYFIFGAND